MNERKWDLIAEAFANGTLHPANGMEAWQEDAVREAILVRAIIPVECLTLMEVGCGVGRMTPFLSVLWPRVVATDTSSACRVVTAERVRLHRNTTVCEPGGIQADAALVWGNLYDDDWSDDEAAAHVCELLACCGYVLVQTSRSFILGFDNARGEHDWTLIGPANHWEAPA